MGLGWVLQVSWAGDGGWGWAGDEGWGMGGVKGCMLDDPASTEHAQCWTSDICALFRLFHCRLLLRLS